MTIQEGPWAPFQPTAEDPWDLRKVAHLHRRAGFGATWAELQRDLRDGPAAGVERLLKPRALTSEEEQVLASLRQGVLDSSDADRLKAWWLYRVLYDRDPLRGLVTLSPGHYTELDVRAAARAFTGWTVEGGKGKFAEAGHDAGAKTFLKQTGPWQSADVVRITLEQPACAAFLCRKLYRFFVSER